MSDGLGCAADDYSEKYLRDNYFGYRIWMYRPYIRAIARRARIPKRGRVLDAGCGQGFFSSLFGRLGFQTLGVDTSAEGIQSAIANFGSALVSFQVGDILSMNAPRIYDCVFCRSCSLYNTENIENSRETTDALLGMVKPGGVLVFDYYTKLSPRKASSSWIYHSLAVVRRHFNRYPRSRVYFTLRIDTLFFGRLSFTLPLYWLSRVISTTTGIGGDIVALVWKTE